MEIIKDKVNKTLKTLNLSIENVQKLKGEQNASALVDQLIKEYYNKTDVYKMNQEELREYIAREELRQEYENKVLELNKKLALENGYTNS